MTRIVGLSATLPNYEDVGAFLRVKPDKGAWPGWGRALCPVRWTTRLRMCAASSAALLWPSEALGGVCVWGGGGAPLQV
jgi:hypothetical protein